MMDRAPSFLILVSTALFVPSACTPPKSDPGGGICNPDELVAALAASSSGDTVGIGDCSVHTNVTVPPGVRLTGQGSGSELVVDSSNGITLQAQAHLTRLSVVSNAAVGIHVSGDNVEISDVSFTGTTGIAVLAANVDGLTIRSLSIAGPVTEATTTTFTPPFDLAHRGTAGIYLNGSGTSEAPILLTDVDISKFGPWGYIGRDSWATWNSGHVSEILGTGILQSGGGLDLHDVEVSQLWQGVLAIPPYGIASSAGARVNTTGVTVNGSEGLGVLHDNALGSHTDFASAGNRFGGVWSQHNSTLQLERAQVTDNGLGGVVAIEALETTITNSSITGTTEALMVFGETGSVRAADGLTLRDSPATLSALTLGANARTGLIVESRGKAVPTLTFDDVDVTATGDAFGAIAQTGTATLTIEWTGLTRFGTAAANDAAFSTRIPTIEQVASEDVGRPPDP